MPRGKPRPKKNLASQRVINALKTTKERGERFYDTEMKGFGITVYPSGRKVFFVEYSPRKNRRVRRRMAIDAYGMVTPDEARRSAKVLLGKVANGDDPLREQKRLRSLPTLRKWVDEWLSKFELEAKPSTYVAYRRYLKLATEAWGDWLLDEITPSAVRQQMMREIAKARNTKISTEVEKATAGRNLSKSQIKKIKEGICLRYETRGRVAANRWLAALRSCFSGAIAEGIVSTNPAMAVNLNDENPPRDRVLSDSELKLLLQAAEEEDPHNRAAIRLAIETGARRSEILRARWEDMNLDEGLWRIPSPKAGKPQVIPLASGTVHWLATLPRLGPYVIAGRDPTQPRFDIKSVWIRVCKKAELTDITFHDLRRTFGKRVERQFGVHVASKLLRHSDVRITSEIYAPFDIEELRAATEDGQRALENVVSIRDARAPVVKRQSSG